MPPISLIDTLPKFITPDEHKTLIASTPTSFSDIPPVLRHQEDNVSITLDPPLAEFGAEACASGSLYIIESVLIYMSASGRGIQVEYPSITLHAISRAENGPSIYCQLDESATNEQEEAEDEVAEMRELIVVPQAATALEPIFEALSLCASLHPDPAAEDDMDDDDDDAFIDADTSPFETFNPADGEELSEVGRAALAHLESIIYDPFDPQAAPATNGNGHNGQDYSDDGSDSAEEK